MASNDLYKYKIMIDGQAVEDIETLSLLTEKEQGDALLDFAVDRGIPLRGLSMALMLTVLTCNWPASKFKLHTYVA